MFSTALRHQLPLQVDLLYGSTGVRILGLFTRYIYIVQQYVCHIKLKDIFRNFKDFYQVGKF